MLIDGFDTTRRVLIVAEIGNNHEGDVAVAERLLDEAAAAGADAVKFQVFRTEQFVRRSDRARFARLRGFELAPRAFERLAKRARAAELKLIATPLDLASAAFLTPLVDAFKIASGDNNFVPLLDQLAATHKPLILSCGIASLDELAGGVARIRGVWAGSGVDPGLAALHCVSAYPVPPEQANVRAVATLAQALGCAPGYSDHTLGCDACVLAVAAGARIIEKHFTLDHHYSDFRDHQLSADPPELAELVRRIRAAETLLGDGRKVTPDCEREAHTAYRRSIAARRDLPAGHVLRWDDLAWTRPGGGLPPGAEARVIGRALRCAVPMGEHLSCDMLIERTAGPAADLDADPDAYRHGEATASRACNDFATAGPRAAQRVAATTG